MSLGKAQINISPNKSRQLYIQIGLSKYSVPKEIPKTFKEKAWGVVTFVPKA